MSANGRLTPAELTYVGNGQYLSNGTAQAFFRMSAAVKADTGVSLTVSDGGGYRDLAAQQYLINHPQGPVPIAPLGYSTHGDGRAVDIRDFASLYVWLRKRAGTFGFYQQFDSEPWHWRFTGAETAGTGITPITAQKEDNMHVIQRNEGNAEWSLIWPALVGPSPLERGYIVTEDATRALWWQRFYGQGSGTADKFGRADYVAAQGYARMDYAAWAAGQPAGVAGVAVDLAPLESAVKGVSGQVAAVDAKISALPKPPTTFTAQ